MCGQASGKPPPAGKGLGLFSSSGFCSQLFEKSPARVCRWCIVGVSGSGDRGPRAVDGGGPNSSGQPYSPLVPSPASLE